LPVIITIEDIFVMIFPKIRDVSITSGYINRESIDGVAFADPPFLSPEVIFVPSDKLISNRIRYCPALDRPTVPETGLDACPGAPHETADRAMSRLGVCLPEQECISGFFMGVPDVVIPARYCSARRCLPVPVL
jgi:hypothetical protein